MSQIKFWQEDASHPNIAKINTLREEVSSLIHINNELTAKLWQIDMKLLTTPSDSSKKELLRHKQELNTELETKNYLEEINTLKNEIYALEVKEFGTSDILNNSPGLSNSLI